MEENTVRTFVYRIISTVLAKENARVSHGKKKWTGLLWPDHFQCLV